MANYYNAESHEYFVNDKKVPSVTSICDLLNGDKLAKLPRAVLETARNRWQKVHEFANKLAYDLPEYEVDNDVIFYCKWLKKWWDDEKPIVLYSEVQLFSNEYCGTADLICIIRGLVYLIDFKTTSILDKNYLSAQLHGYKNLIEKKLGIKIDKTAVVYITKDDYPNFKEIEADEKLWDCLYYIYKKLNNKKEKTNGK